MDEWISMFEVYFDSLKRVGKGLEIDYNRDKKHVYFLTIRSKLY